MMILIDRLLCDSSIELWIIFKILIEYTSILDIER